MRAPAPLATVGYDTRMWLLLHLACTPQTPAPAGFTCETAPAFLGRPGAKLVACDALAGFPELVNVALDVEGRREVRTVVLVDGRPLADRGDAAFQAWLEALPPERVAQLTLGHLVSLLRAFDAFPEPFDARSAGFDLPAIGTSSFTPRPFRLVLYAGTVPGERFYRATLVGREVPWAWTVEERQPDGSWAIPG